MRTDRQTSGPDTEPDAYTDFRRFLRERSRKDMAERTLTGYLKQLRIMREKYGLDLDDLGLDHLRQVFDDMEENCSVPTMNYRKMLVKLWFDYKDIDLDKDRRRLLQSKDKKYAKYDAQDMLTQEELWTIIKHTRSPAMRAYYAVLYDTGARPNELLGLNMADVIQSRDGVELNFREGKTPYSKRIVLLLIPKAEQFLEQWLSIHPRRLDPDAPLFLQGQGLRMKKGTVLQMLKRYHEKRLKRGNGKAPLTLYLFRHSRGTQLMQDFNDGKPGALPPAEIKRRMGQAAHSTTLEKHYLHQSQDDHRRAQLRAKGVLTEDATGQALAICYRCGASNEPASVRCFRCGQPLTEEARLQELTHKTDLEAQLAELRGQLNQVLEYLVDSKKATVAQESIKDILDTRKA